MRSLERIRRHRLLVIYQTLKRKNRKDDMDGMGTYVIHDSIRSGLS